MALNYEIVPFMRFFDKGKVGLKLVNGICNGKFVKYETDVLDARYDMIEWRYGSCSGPFLAKKNEKWGLVDWGDKVLIDFKYSTILFYGPLILLVSDKGKQYYVDYFGKEYKN